MVAGAHVLVDAELLRTVRCPASMRLRQLRCDPPLPVELALASAISTFGPGSEVESASRSAPSVAFMS